jgi:cardiolipin synthase
VDGFGARDLSPRVVDTLERSGSKIQVYRRPLWWQPVRGLRRMHRKLVVIDGGIGFCGGINVLDDRDGRGDGPPRFDFAVRVTGPVVADMHRAVRRLWMLVRWTTLGRLARNSPATAPALSSAEAGGQRAAFLTRDNLRHRRSIEEAYLLAIGQAREEIFIACAYFLPSRGFRDALRAARRRGVRVRLLLQGVPEYPFVRHAMRAFYRDFVRDGIEVHEYLTTFLHAKVAVIDGLWATVGSSNIDPFSLMLSREANVVVEDPGFARELCGSLERAKSWLALRLGRAFVGLTGYARREDL